MSVSIHFLSWMYKCYVFQIFVSSLIFHTNVIQSLHFKFTSFDQYNALNISYTNDSAPVNGSIQLTANRVDADLQSSAGRVSYSQPVRLWDKTTNQTTNFTTHFSFKILQLGNDPFYYKYGDGITFFIAPFEDTTAYAPHNSAGGCLGLVSGNGSNCNVTSKYPFVAVEFDTFNNVWDPSKSGTPSYDHLGIDVNSIVSEASSPWGSDLQNGTAANAWITYDSSTKNLSVYLTYDTHPVFNGEPNLFYVIDLSLVLPETVRVGFTSSTGKNLELHYILSWEFNSTLADTESSPVIVTRQNHTGSKTKAGLIGGVVVAVTSVLTVGLGVFMFVWWKNRSPVRRNEGNFCVDDDFDQETGPKRFSYNQLSRATNDFHEEGKLGEGGFGGVFRGYLSDLNRAIAVKKISRESKQGIKEYVSEVKIISLLRHKNLVQLLGWCHEQGHLLLVYELMPNGSLDSHLYGGKKGVLQWTERYRIAQGLASALLYLHIEWEQCVLHRDIKSSNVMLDSNFHAKLGDFGLARLVDHNLGSQTTVLAGTLGYLAPECGRTGKSSKESDVYSFGVVALEIACGRKPIEFKEVASKVNMIEWVWQLYGEGHLLEAVDKRLEGEFDIQQIECLMVVGLWCCHPDYTFRPSVKQVIKVLNMESSLPKLPAKFPVPIYCSVPPSEETVCTSSSTSGLTGTSTDTNNSSSQAAVPGTAPLIWNLRALLKGSK